MLVRLDHGSPVPLGDQIAAAVRGAIADATVHPGERLPAARALADSLGVNVHTVLRGYQQLREEGLIELRRGRGAVVTADAAAPGRARLTDGVRALVADARALGMSDEEVVNLVRGGLAGS
ncbi:GntR family transcriptional regulator [Streptomyces hiroshimensis]|uniref:GntR family transcriptional regulator n=1 Tax=Streptomyces hiroshimensis TaxID=66424 RepID=A0ABQ2Y572_9ACTN|nr:GntR family transcriptional regulator [Streptomyces hiroshimensis]GGX60860.1 GntR family transcriptional regulator [Streptomyces hiroshimensis]